MGDFGGSACTAGDFAGKKDWAVEAGVEGRVLMVVKVANAPATAVALALLRLPLAELLATVLLELALVAAVVTRDVRASASDCCRKAIDDWEEAEVAAPCDKPAALAVARMLVAEARSLARLEASPPVLLVPLPPASRLC
jgi:hypothetical protein